MQAAATHLVDGESSRHHLALVEHKVVVVCGCFLLGKVADDDDLVATFSELSEQWLEGAKVGDGWVREQSKDAMTFTCLASKHDGEQQHDAKKLHF